MSLLLAWEKSQPAIKEEIGKTSYDTWFSNLEIKEVSASKIIIETPDDFFKDWIVDKYFSIINKHLLLHSNYPIDIEFNVNSQMQKTYPVKDTSSRGFNENPVIADVIKTNSRFTFDNFVVGPSNRFACAASLAVSEQPAKAYNPLFIYGQVGLGKTHLMQSISHKIKEIHPHLKCKYLSSEQFTNELIDSIRHRSTTEFRQRYRNIDVLLIDDIQFIAGKDSTQEEFFHTFNALHDNRKQIIISSDRSPKEISNLEDRLISRFSWGLITDIQPPDFETRVAILKKKAEQDNVHVYDDVITFIADQIKTNIRELEGALIRVVAFSLLEDKPVTLDIAKQVLKDMVKESVKIISIEMIQKTIAEHFNVTIGDLKSSRRHKNIVFPRQIAMFLSRKLTKRSLPEIGKAFGGKDHTSVLHSCKKIEKDINSNSELKESIQRIEIVLQQ